MYYVVWLNGMINAYFEKIILVLLYGQIENKRQRLQL